MACPMVASEIPRGMMRGPLLLSSRHTTDAGEIEAARDMVNRILEASMELWARVEVANRKAKRAVLKGSRSLVRGETMG